MSLKVSTSHKDDAPVQLTEVQARILCVGADNGRTPLSSWNNAGEPPDLVRFNYPFESCGVELGNSSGGVSVEGEGQLIGPTSGWTQQFTSNTANDGKGVPADGSSLDLNTWVGYFNSLLDSDKYCAAFGVAPARTWRYMRVCTIDPCAKFGLWTLKWLDAEDSTANMFYVGWPEELVEEEVIKRAYYDREEKNGDIVREWFVQELDEESGEFEWVPVDQPTWQPSRTADLAPIPNDCWIPCNEKFDDWRVEGAQSPCTYKTFDLCDFLEDGTQIELKLFLTDCDGSRTRELYTADQVLTTTDPLDPAVDQYEVQGDLKNCDGTEFEEPPVADPDKVQTLVDCPDPCINGSTYINGRPPASNAWSWGPYSAENLNDFEAALIAAGYTVEKFGEKHQVCPPFGSFGEDSNALLTNGIGDGFVPPVEPNINPDFVADNQCAALTTGKNDDRRDNCLDDIKKSFPALVSCESGAGSSVTYAIPPEAATEQSYGIGEVSPDGPGIKFDTAEDLSAELLAAHQATIDCINGGGIANMVITDQDGATVELNLDTVIGDGNPQFVYSGEVVDGEPSGGKIRQMVVTCSTGEVEALPVHVCNFPAQENSHVIEGCIDQDGVKVDAFTIIDDAGNALFAPKPKTDLGFAADCCNFVEVPE